MCESYEADRREILENRQRPHLKSITKDVATELVGIRLDRAL